MGEVARCRSFWGHRFETRCDEVAPTPEAIAAFGRHTPLIFANDLIALRTEIYRGDVCVRCGLSVNNSPQDMLGKDSAQ